MRSVGEDGWTSEAPKQPLHTATAGSRVRRAVQVKISDVAREAGVSSATVSRALNNHPNVTEEKLRRILNASERLGYRGNSAARNLRRRSSELISLVIPDIEDYFCTAVARGAEQVAHQNGYSLLLCNSAGDPQAERAYLAVAESQQVAGILISPTQASNIDPFREKAGDQIPIIAIDVGVGDDFDSVVTDSYDGGRLAADHLWAQGWSRPACVAGPRDSPTASARAAGFSEAMAGHGLSTAVIHTEFDRAGGEHGVAELLDFSEPPDCVFAVNERIATGVLTELRRRRVRPGRDLGLVSFDDAPWAPIVDVPLTVVAQPAYDMGATAVRLLLDRLSAPNRSDPSRIVLPVRLIVRESSLKPSAEPF